MAAGQLRYSSFFTSTALLLVVYLLHDVETSSCERNTIHKKVGDTVELSSCSPAEGVTAAQWKHRGSIIADKNKNGSVKPQFTGRLELNPTSFDLTVRRLTLQDSGDFSFMSEVNDRQRYTVTITLHVHEPITIEPTVTPNSSWHASTNSCRVDLQCSATAGSSVTYSWAVRNETLRGSRLLYIITPEDGDVNFTCSISNVVSEKSASVTVKCSSDPRESVSYFSSIVLLIVGPVIGLLLFMLLLLSLLCYTKSKGPCCNRVAQSQPVNPDESQQQVYSSLLHGDDCVYETVRGFEDAGTATWWSSAVFLPVTCCSAVLVVICHYRSISEFMHDA